MTSQEIRPLLGFFSRSLSDGDLMSSSCLSKQNAIVERFADCATPEERYQRIMDLGREMPALDVKYKREDNLVKGCQSQMYLHTEFDGERLHFEGASDALISQGLAALLIMVYDAESPETVLTCAPDFLETLQVTASLSPNRANGLHSLHLRMKQEALKAITQRQV